MSPAPVLLPLPLPQPIPALIDRSSAWGGRHRNEHSEEVCEERCAKDSACEDDDPCTVDTCDDATCVNTPVAGCASCDIDSDCIPGLKCPSPTCSDRICTYPATSDCAFLSSIRVTPVAITLSVGAFQKFTAIGHFSDGSDVDITELTGWLSSKTAVATVSDTEGSKGLAKGISTGVATITATFEGLIGVAQLSVIEPRAALFAYITQDGFDYVVECPVNLDGSLNIANCIHLNDPSFNSTYGIAINNSGTFAYIGNRTGNSVSKCAINPINGHFTSCTTVGSLFSGPTGLTLNKAGTLAYIVNNGPADIGVTKCTINPINGSFTNCTLLTDSTFSQPFGIALNDANNNAYITNSNNTVSKCPIDPITDSFLACTASIPEFNLPIGIAIHSMSGIAYVVNSQTPNLVRCPINPDGSLATCLITLGNPPFSLPFRRPSNLTLDEAQTTAYLLDGIQGVLRCTINPDGSFVTPCTLQSPIPSFDNGTAIAFIR